MFKINASQNSINQGRNASATRIPSIRTSTKKKYAFGPLNIAHRKFNMNQSVDMVPKTHSDAKMKTEGNLRILGSSDSDHEDEVFITKIA